MTDVVLKGEVHTSEGDLAEERELLKQDFDTLVLEGDESEPEFGPLDGWFNMSIELFKSTFGQIYVDKTILLDLADVQDTDIVFTRESDSEMLRNTPRLVQLFAALLFYVITPFSIIYGARSGNVITGATSLLVGAMLPILTVRIYNTKRSRGSENRDQIIADKIKSAAEDGDRVLAVMGKAHLNGVRKRLPGELEIDQKDPAYSFYSGQHLREIIRPGFTAFSVLFVIYLAAIYIAEATLLAV